MSSYGTVATLPLAAGTPHNCYYYYNHYDRPATIPPAQQNLWAPPPKTCENIASIINIDVEELIRLNPSLSSSDCTIKPGLSYCAQEAPPTTTSPSTASGSTTPEPPICSFDPNKGEYICPDPRICRFDPEKGEYACPDAAPTAGFEQGAGGERAELR